MKSQNSKFMIQSQIVVAVSEQKIIHGLSTTITGDEQRCLRGHFKVTGMTQ